MDISGEYRIPARREAVWQGLNDPDVLRQCIPGCESLEKVSDTAFNGAVIAKVGPVKAKFQGGVTLSDLDPPKGYVLSGEGKGAAAGFAKGSAKVDLEEDGQETVLRYKVDAQVGGKLAQVGARLIDGTVKKLSAEFFENFTRVLAAQGEAAVPVGEPAAAPQPAPQPGPTAAPATPPAATAEAAGQRPQPAPKAGGVHPAVWVVGAIVVVGALLWIFAGNG